MRRPSRSFTVEVKRSRSRAGEVAAAEPRPAPPASLPSSLSSSLSWGDLVSRAAEELGGELGGAFSSGIGGETAPARPAAHDAGPGGNVPEAVHHGRQAGAAPSRVLPSLLPAETPLSGRRAGIRESDATPHSADSPVSPRSRLPGQGRAPAPSTALRHAPTPIATPAPAPATPEAAAPEAIGTLDAGRIRALVEQHLRRQSVAGEQPAEAAIGEDAAVQHEVDTPPAGKRRRGDFWKRRLRSYAARD